MRPPGPDGALDPSAQAVYAELAVFDLAGEVFSDELPLVAFNVPADADLTAIKKLLEQGQEDGRWHYEVG